MKSEDWGWLTICIAVLFVAMAGFGVAPYRMGTSSGMELMLEESLDDPERFEARQEIVRAKRNLANQLTVELR